MPSLCWEDKTAQLLYSTNKNNIDLESKGTFSPLRTDLEWENT